MLPTSKPVSFHVHLLMQELKLMRLLTGIFLSAVLLMTMDVAAAPISYSGGTYTQDFNGLPVTGSTTLLTRGPHDIEGVLGGSGVPGWTMSNYSGTGADTEYRAQDGSLAGGSGGRGVVSFGTTSSSERALGELPTSNQIGRFGVAFTNDTTSTLTQFSLSFTGEQWRRGDILAPAPAPGNTISYQYSVGATNINTGAFTNIGSFSSPNTQLAPLNVALDGNLAANQVAVSAFVTNINWAPGTTLTVRWNGFDVSGQDDGLAIDNVNFSADVPEPATFALAVIMGFAAFCIRWQR
jgi:hypothetical protein